jgi:hypothetical protein
VPVSDRGIKAVAWNATSLKQLRMYDLQLVKDTSFLNSCQSTALFPKLRHLLLHGSPGLHEETSLENVGAPMLERLELVGCYRLEEKTMKKLLGHWKGLKRFIYVGAQASSEFQRELKRKLPDCKITIFAPEE